MAKIHRILHNGMYILPETVTDAVLDNQMQRTLTELLADKLSAVEADTAEGEITFEAGLTANGKGVVASKVVSDFLVSVGFTPNFGGSGFSLEIVDGKSYLTVDNAYIRNKATFDELEVREVTHTGGVEIKSPASCKIANIDDYYPHIAWVDADGQEIADKDGVAFMVMSAESTGVKCYFRASDGEKTIYNDWRVGDQALCQSFNVENGSRYYWRRVIDVSAEPENGYHWVALSLTDGEGDTPMSGDTIVCFGSSIVDRQAAIIMAANGTNAPCFVQLKGISTYRVDESNVVTLLSPTKNIIKGHQIVMMSEDGEKDVAAEFRVQSDMISSVVSKQSDIVDDYTFADFSIKNGWSPDWAGAAIGSPVGFEKVDDACQMLVINNAKVGDVVRIKPNATSQTAIIEIIGTDGNAQGAEQDAYDLNSSEYGNYTWYGLALTERYAYDIEVGGSIEFVVSVDCPELCVWLSDDWSEKINIELSHIKAKMSAQSRIEQSADNIRLQVGQAGINLDNQNITLTASKTTINGDLAVGVVKCYYDEAKTQLRSAYNGNGDGTIVYYYPNGKVMRQDSFVTDTSGNVIGMRTTYYKADGSVAWVLSEGGIQTTLAYYWEALNGGNALAYTDSTTTMMDICTQYLDTAMQYFSKSQFSRFVTQSDYKDYNGKIAKGLKSSETPDSVTLYSGVLVYSIELVEDGVRPTYQVAYEQVTAELGQVSLIMTKKFNSLGEIN